VRATGVICRFLSLLDVVLILLGLLMILLTQAQFQARKGTPAAGTAEGLQGIAAVDFIYLYAGTYGEERGRCYLVGPDRKLLREVRTDTADDLRRVLPPAAGQDRPNRVIMLLVSDKGFDSMWDSKRLAAMEKTWGYKVIPIYNFNLSKP
jgi:hypothetical protein